MEEQPGSRAGAPCLMKAAEIPVLRSSPLLRSPAEPRGEVEPRRARAGEREAAAAARALLSRHCCRLLGFKQRDDLY